MIIDWPSDFGDWLDRLDARVRSGDEHARAIRRRVLAALRDLQVLSASPTTTEETPWLKWVRQSKRYPVWRTSHPYIEGVAVRVICYFPPEQTDTVVVALFAGEKATMGDVFYDSVGNRADALIDQWYRQTKEQS